MKHLLIIALFLVCISNSFSQVSQDAFLRYDGTSHGFDFPARSMAADNLGNVYVTGYSEGINSDYDIVTVKYSFNKKIEWVKRHNGPANGYDEGRDIVVDRNGFVYVVGWQYTNNVAREDVVLIKYDQNGNEIWVKTVDGEVNGDDRGHSIFIEEDGDIFVAGCSWSNSLYYDSYLIKFNSDGNVVWQKKFNGSGDGYDIAWVVKVNNSGNIIVSGQTYSGPASSDDYFLLKYSQDGEIIASTTYDYNGFIDIVRTMDIDKFDNVYLSGGSRSRENETNMDIATVKFNPNCEKLWVRVYNAAGDSADYANVVKVDNENNVIIGGSSIIGYNHFDYITLKYDSNGNELWKRTYNNQGIDRFDCINGLALDANCNVFVTGRSFGGWTDTHNDYYTIKYDKSGNQLWGIRFNGKDNKSDYATACILDKFGNLYVSGWSEDAQTKEDFGIVIYKETLTSLTQTNADIPKEFKLNQNYPNPFNPATTISFDVASNDHIKLYVYDQLGREVAKLLDKNLSAGSYNVSFDASGLSSGVYFYSIRGNSIHQTKKMIFNK